MINLMFCGNDKVIDGMIISLLSIVKHCKKPLNVFILTMDLHELNEKYMPINQKHIAVLDKILKQGNEKSQIHLIDITKYFKEEMMNSANIDTHYTPYILVRLYSDKVDELPDKVLYLDSDLVIYKNIEPLYDTKVDGYHFAAAGDYLGQFFINKKYINSGVLLMNMKKMREEDIFPKCRKMVVEKKMLLPDQTALNEYCTQIKYLPSKYNEQNKRQEDTVIRHFSMCMKFMVPLSFKKRKMMNKYRPVLRFLPIVKFLNIKPWHIEGIHEIYKIHDFDDILEEYKKLKGELE